MAGEDSWRDNEFITTNFGLGMINIIDYFSLSPFFDKQSITQQLLTQKIPIDKYQEAAHGLRGTYYEFESPHPMLFLIYEYRDPPYTDSEKPRLLNNVFYCFDGTVYPAPKISDIFQRRLAAIQNCVSKMLDAHSNALDS
ncbi:Mediator complex subunit Med6 [Carpediemonas membranifera]|uniref:Mediator of RNA polymerase II transcription subunit 6 n=1 Tax=Carpediemonas membranifera TaxID=201153 RepID=A0A8J6E1B5_9EUKA|nr:Mediator complex subunit Med6 [Carpediemonas membranifera]|eukprot:KAG9396144.1 Mediator complex subunit Med6 [Carpediemonas membranifera]